MTNRFKTPLLIIAGVNNLHMTIYAAFCFLARETTEDYVWALTQLHTLYAGNDPQAFEQNPVH